MSCWRCFSLFFFNFFFGKLAADNLSGTLFAQDTRLLRLRTPVSAFPPAKERQHAGVFALPTSLIEALRWECRSVVSQLAPATGLIQYHLNPTALTRIAGRTLSTILRLWEGAVEGLWLSRHGRRWCRGPGRSVRGGFLRLEDFANRSTIIPRGVSARGGQVVLRWW